MMHEFKLTVRWWKLPSLEMVKIGYLENTSKCINRRANNGSTKTVGPELLILLRLEMFGGFISMDIFCIEKTEAGSADGDSEWDDCTDAGKILEVKVADGQTVEAGELLLVMEAMKMEHRIVAPTDGVVTKVNFSTGDQVQQGDV